MLKEITLEASTGWNGQLFPKMSDFSWIWVWLNRLIRGGVRNVPRKDSTEVIPDRDAAAPEEDNVKTPLADEEVRL